MNEGRKHLEKGWCGLPVQTGDAKVCWCYFPTVHRRHHALCTVIIHDDALKPVKLLANLLFFVFFFVLRRGLTAQPDLFLAGLFQLGIKPHIEFPSQ